MKPKTTFEKRRKEQARTQRKKDKAEKRAQRKDDKGTRVESADGEDPDIAHIVWGQSVEYDDYGNPILEPTEPTDSEAAAESSADD